MRVSSIDVLLTHSNHLFSDRKQVQKMQPYPALQTLLAAAYLRRAGMRVAFCDVTFDSPAAKLEHVLKTTTPRLLVVCEDDFNFLSKMCLARNRERSFEFAGIARSYGCASAVHGSDSSDHVSEYLEAGFGAVLIGEVEETLLELASGRPLEDIRGLAYRCDADSPIRYNMPRPLRKCLDSLPMAAWDLVDIEPYRRAWKSQHGYFSLNMISSRGCPYKCNWCAKPIHGDNYRARSAEDVAKEMLHLKTTYQAEHLWFADDIFALSARWTLAFSEAVNRLGAQIPFKMQSRCDLMTRNLAGTLKGAGCDEVWMGAESGSQRILDAMDKCVRVNDIYCARQNLAEHGIRAGLFLQFGYLGETWEDIEATVRMVRETRPDDIGVSVSYPLPGTKFHQLVASRMGRKTQWSDSGDLAIMFEGAYSSEFYRALADALHLEVRAPDAKEHIKAAWGRALVLREERSCRTVVA